MRLKDKVTLISGASSGVGYSTALLFAKHGAKVYAIARRQNRLEELVEENKKENNPGEIIAIPADISKSEDVDRVFDVIEKNDGKLDILISNAGVMDKFEPVVNIKEEELDRILSINLKGPFRLIKKSIPLMKDGGSIVATSSVASIRGGKAGTAYTVSKHALNGLIKNTAAMYGNKKIRANVVAPGGIETEILKNFENVDMEGMEIINNGAKVAKLTATAEEIANNILFLASDESSNINGAILVTDGGLTNI
ncbi:SDR family NAD(P)-dependent oxidoreductase [Peptoniphilus sp. SGI.035]|uniref:SDR family NAD(P)-dependent oxidoreductase n=1 Tax=Peptoniphilus sp. SGI.035 TaxID=3420564 RepID=UPI003CFCC24C